MSANTYTSWLLSTCTSTKRIPEGKHRHIVEIELALLAKASMSLKFWDEAFSTTVRLINVLSTRVIQMRNPTEMLLKKKPDYSSLKVFRSVYSPNLR
jgi:hypothetical protein